MKMIDWDPQHCANVATALGVVLEAFYDLSVAESIDFNPDWPMNTDIRASGGVNAMGYLEKWRDRLIILSQALEHETRPKETPQ